MNILLKLSSALLLTMLVGCNISGCSFTNTEPFVDTERDEQGDMRLLDTPRMWKNWTENVDFRVSNEVSGRRPPGGKSTWNEFWLHLIDENKEGRENFPKYIGYIIEQRRKVGLPELEASQE